MKIFIVTTSRSDFGLLKNLILEFKKNSMNFKVIAAGSHFLKDFGATSLEIAKNNIKLYKTIKLHSKFETAEDISVGISNHLLKFVNILKKKKPDLIVLLGDRFEVFSIAIAAYILRIPIAHIHGGEVTEGSLDDAYRHCITKMSNVHFVSHDIYKKRIIQMGEDPKSVYNVGALGVDSIKNTKLFNQQYLEKKFKIKFLQKNIIVTLHPEITGYSGTKLLVNELLKSLKKLKNTGIFFTGPGADISNLLIKKKLKDFVKKNNNSYYFDSLGQKNYLSFLSIVDCMVGNSSSGIIEMPSFKKATINIGTRQMGRVKSKSIIDCRIKNKEISKALHKVFTTDFNNKNFKNPYDKNHTARKITKILKLIKIKNFFKKNFYDL